MTTLRYRRAFTLVEVLIATFIIAIGMLGLLALFAGAASQQQTATQATAATTMAYGARAVLEPRFGRLVIGAATTPPAPGVWSPLAMNQEFQTLTVNPNCRDDLYFVVDARGDLLYEQRTWVPGEPGFTGGTPVGALATLKPLGQRRVEPNSLVFVVTVADNDGSTVPYFYYRTQQVYQGDQPGSDRYVYPFNGDDANSALDYIIVDVQDAPCRLDIRRAYIHAMNIGAVAADTLNKYIQTIEVRPYQWRNDQLVSLSDRILNRADPSAPGGERPDISYSVLYQQDSGVARMAVVTYQLTPESGGAQYIPPEYDRQDFQGVNGYRNPPLRRANLALGYDPDAQAYYFSPSNDDDEFLWATTPGQILIVAGNANVVPATPGADSEVRVVRRERRMTGSIERWRGYINDSPRRNNVSMLPLVKRENGAVEELTVFGVNDVVTSRAPDRSRWRLKPLQVNVFQIRTE